MSDNSMKEMLEEELDKRFKMIESPDYRYVDRLSKADYFGMLAVAIASLAIIAFGIL